MHSGCQSNLHRHDFPLLSSLLIVSHRVSSCIIVYHLFSSVRTRSFSSSLLISSPRVFENVHPARHLEHTERAKNGAKMNHRPRHRRHARHCRHNIHERLRRGETANTGDAIDTTDAIDARGGQEGHGDGEGDRGKSVYAGEDGLDAPRPLVCPSEEGAADHDADHESTEHDPRRHVEGGDLLLAWGGGGGTRRNEEE